MNSTYTRRQLITSGAMLGAAKLGGATGSTLSFGMIADVHHGLMPDAYERLEAFLKIASARKLDFIIQLGDFCHPKPEARDFVKLWHSYRGRRHNVLGNHDMDFGTKAQAMDLWEMQKNYYSFDVGAFHFIVLDCNYLNFGAEYRDFANGNYFGAGEKRDWVNPEQIEWLRADLAAAKLPSVVFTHQGIGEYWSPNSQKNRINVRNTLSDTNRAAGWQKAIAVFSGHHHVDHHGERDGVNYLLVNSASYYWVGETYGSLAKYKDPLFQFVTLDPAGRIAIEGRASSFVPPTPAELNYPYAQHVTASIESRVIAFQPAGAAGRRNL